MDIGDKYPNRPPVVQCLSTHSNQIRLNPNIYSCGKVCLSLLGTWMGDRIWNSNNIPSNLGEIVLAIQSSILTSAPIRNEPGRENMAMSNGIILYCALRQYRLV
jgi:ubiquitin-protein ligase